MLLAKGRRGNGIFICHLDEHLIRVCSVLFSPFAGEECKSHPLRFGSNVLLVLEVPKMSVDAICFASSGINGGRWVVLVSTPYFFLFFGKTVFF